MLHEVAEGQNTTLKTPSISMFIFNIVMKLLITDSLITPAWMSADSSSILQSRYGVKDAVDN